MIHPPASVRVYLATSPCDMRRSFDGLHALVNAVLQLHAFAGHLFVFSNRRRDRVKILYWGVSRMQVKTCRACTQEMGEGLPGVDFQEFDFKPPGAKLRSKRRVVVNVRGKGAL